MTGQGQHSAGGPQDAAAHPTGHTDERDGPHPGGLERRTTGQLLAGYAATLAELRRRGVVRSANAPAGDYAEWVAARALGGTLVENFSVKSHDLTLPGGDRVQVKTRVTSDPPRGGQLQTSPFRSWHFEHAALLLLRDTDYLVLRAVLLPRAVAEAAGSRREHVNGWVLQMTPTLLDHPAGRDFTDDARRAATEA